MSLYLRWLSHRLGASDYTPPHRRRAGARYAAWMKNNEEEIMARTAKTEAKKANRKERSPEERKRFRIRSMLWSFVAILALAVILPTTTTVLNSTVTTAEAQIDSTSGQNQRSNFWRAVRQGNEGTSSIKGAETGTLINNNAQNWREMRLGMLCLILFFYVFKGRIPIEHERSGRRVPRWNIGERVLHWFTAIMFVILAITGLSMLFGRAVLIPVLGAEAFAAWAGFAINAHNVLGPFFTVGVVFMFLFWVKNNIPNAVDFEWFSRGGGIIGDDHPSAGKANGGEKVWFWIVMILGLGFVCWSGFVLIGWLESLIPTTRAAMQSYQMIHAWSAIVWICIFFGHAYIGTIGTEGALEGMTTGSVSSEWARQHHDIWYDKVKDNEYVDTGYVKERRGRTADQG